MHFSPVSAFLAFATLVLAPAAPARGTSLGAQDGHGTTFIAGVADAETGQPLEGAEVILLGVHRLARANALGEATIDQVPRGAQRIRVRKLGYAPSEVDVAMIGDTTGAVFRLQRSVVQLGTVHVEAEWTPPKMKDVEVRRKQGIGRFLDETQLDKERDRDFSLVVASRFPGLTTLLDSSGHRYVAGTRGFPPCRVTVYLDGVFLGEDTDVVRTWDLAVVEYYTGMQVPVRYRTHAYGCGVLLLWSKWY